MNNEEKCVKILDGNSAIPAVGKFEKVSFAQFEKSLVDLGTNVNKEDAFALWDSIRLPSRATSGSAGYDFYSPIDFLLGGDGTSVTVPTGIRVKMEPGWVLLIFPRSGLGFKHRLTLDNSCGVIDFDYYFADNEGHIMLKMHKADDHVPLSIKQTDRFAQGIFIPFGITSDDNATAARTGGLGSTGLR